MLEQEDRGLLDVFKKDDVPHEQIVTAGEIFFLKLCNANHVFMSLDHFRFVLYWIVHEPYEEMRSEIIIFRSVSTIELSPHLNSYEVPCISGLLYSNGWVILDDYNLPPFVI